MREILFRAKRIDNGEWVYGDLINEPYGMVIQYCEDEIKDKGNCAKTANKKRVKATVDPETVCQYTGLTDKNGRKIFEGNIVKGVAYSTDFIGYIVWIDAIAGFGVRYFNKRREPTAWENSSILKAIQRWKHPNEFQAEIIGNIFDNPELIGEQP